MIGGQRLATMMLRQAAQLIAGSTVVLDLGQGEQKWLIAADPQIVGELVRLTLTGGSEEFVETVFGNDYIQVSLLG
jgi:hypothetical protein